MFVFQQNALFSGKSVGLEYWMDTMMFVANLYIINMYMLKDLWNRLFLYVNYSNIACPLIWTADKKFYQELNLIYLQKVISWYMFPKAVSERVACLLSKIQPALTRGVTRAMNTIYGSDGILSGGKYKISWNYKAVFWMFFKNSSLFR